MKLLDQQRHQEHQDQPHQGHHHHRHRHRHRHLPMARASMWGPEPLSPEKATKLTMMIEVWRYCLIGLCSAVLWAVFVHSLHTSFWSNVLARELARLHLP